MKKRRLNHSTGVFLLFNDFPADSPAAVGEVVTKDLEGPYLGGVFHVCTDAGAGIIVSNFHYAECLRDILGEFAQINICSCLSEWHELNSDIKILSYHLIDLCLYFGYLGLCGLSIEDVVTFGLFLLDMSVSGAGTAEHLYHGGIKYMLGSMHRGMLLLVVLVKYRCLHSLYFSA